MSGEMKPLQPSWKKIFQRIDRTGDSHKTVYPGIAHAPSAELPDARPNVPFRQTTASCVLPFGFIPGLAPDDESVWLRVRKGRKSIGNVVVVCEVHGASLAKLMSRPNKKARTQRQLLGHGSTRLSGPSFLALFALCSAAISRVASRR